MLTRRSVLKAIASSASVTLPLAPYMAKAETLGSGTFEGKSRHVTTGTARIVTEGGKSYVQLGPDFTFDGAPDPKVALGKDGYDASTLLAPLASNTGAQDYAIPASIDASGYNEVWIWCERFNVPLGVAKLTN